ncbi:hypothetical protein T265_05188 [Opisthorchis viverrini]|uniref:Uncharacterized protein n=1 Tax=Opisthorchis viverrini TaxID=6198 RepID=A0A074ZKH1_OPIVI|nr:hypothetical protein T265_05188 [Opisthorchis viverrini]KER27828.1 hypothetical protein T265_05188 [Opisthorchis viverrini]
MTVIIRFFLGGITQIDQRPSQINSFPGLGMEAVWDLVDLYAWVLMVLQQISQTAIVAHARKWTLSVELHGSEVSKTLHAMTIASTTLVIEQFSSCSYSVGVSVGPAEFGEFPRLEIGIGNGKRGKRGGGDGWFVRLPEGRVTPPAKLVMSTADD